MAEIATFIFDLASADPVPGGGSVAALQAAMGAALLVMVSNLTVGRKRYADVSETVMAIRDTASQLVERSMKLVDEDIAAYRAVSDVLSLPKESPDEKQVRSTRMQIALQGAVSPPLDTMRVASQILDLAVELAPIGNRSAISDVGTAASAARAAFEAALLNVEINLASIHDAGWVDGTQETVRSFPSASTRAEHVSKLVLGVIRS